ncbi:helix-turn-helix transcriptional regulator [Mycolicibacter arupensis]|nr:helix-turn-helix transcriptional regulator [Mycolicibacter arupensis]
MVSTPPASIDDSDRDQRWALYRETVGRQIRSLRLRENLSQESLALEAGMSRDNLIKVEHGRRSITFERIYDLASALGVPVSHLLPDIDQH